MNYYFYEIEDGKCIRIKKISKEDSEFDDHFTVTEDEFKPGDLVVVGLFNIYHSYLGNETRCVVDHTLEGCLSKLDALKEYHYDSDSYVSTTVSNIRELKAGENLEFHLDITGEFIRGVYFPVDCKISVFEARLPLE